MSGRLWLEQELLVPLGDIVPATPAGGDEAQSRSLFDARLHDVLRDGLANERGHGPPLAARQRLELALDFFLDEDRRTFHMSYANI
jgi:hypothetical protein